MQQPNLYKEVIICLYFYKISLSKDQRNFSQVVSFPCEKSSTLNFHHCQY